MPKLNWKLLTKKRGSATQGLPPGKEGLAWVTNTVTLIYGERDAVVVDTFLSVQHSKELFLRFARTPGLRTWCHPARSEWRRKLLVRKPVLAACLWRPPTHGTYCLSRSRADKQAGRSAILKTRNCSCYRRLANCLLPELLPPTVCHLPDRASVPPEFRYALPAAILTHTRQCSSAPSTTCCLFFRQWRRSGSRCDRCRNPWENAGTQNGCHPAGSTATGPIPILTRCSQSALLAHARLLQR